MDDRVIDIRGYLADARQNKGPGAFAVWGGSGDRSRFALPIWRAIYLVGGDWGGIVALDASGKQPRPDPYFILDLREDPARTQIVPGSMAALASKDPPVVNESESEAGGLLVLLGKEEGRSWFLQVRGQKPEAVLERPAMETLLFLAGECAGLLFLRQLSTLFPSAASTP